ncbi:uncharacterized protein LOC121752669 [Salvia splendens]|uniref:uncharacterized protein LOC121752669 n=1 Tax=Salvia splendens TaxID=180675 RepID=UPI001C27028F|nr:uncharacterized protein LOC121752669 [Salvia splendens]
MICDDDNESDSPISTAVLGSPRTASLSIQQQEVNASEHDNTLASLIGSENSGNELEIQEEVEADRELTTQDALHILSKVCGDYEISNNEEAIKATNTIVDIINEQEDREDTAACSIVEYMMQEGIETMDDTPPECNVQKQGYRGKETMHEEKEKTSENAERRMTVYQNPVPFSEIPLAEARERRTHAEMRPSPVLRSPFEIRAVHMKPTLNLDERDIYHYIVETEGTNDDTCAYTNGFVWASKGVFSSLKPHTEISIGVIDVWATYLNFRENERAVTSPPRLFLTTSPCYLNITNREPHWNTLQSKNNFMSRIDQETSRIQDFDWRKVDLVFFPVFTSGYYYLVKDMFEAYFKEKNISELSQNIKKSPYKVVPLDWATSTNKEDSGIYLMRHMETYFGRKEKEWNIGFSQRGTKILQILRGRYCEAMLTSRSNKKYMDMVRVADDWMIANKHRLPELQNKFKEWFSCRSKK